MDPKIYYTLALALCEKTNDPASIRSSISRAYYAVFNLSFEVLNKIGISVLNNSNAHSEIIVKLKNSGNSEAQKFGVQIGDLHTKRLDADYFMRPLKTNIEDQKMAKVLVLNASKIISFLDRCTSEPLKSEIFNGIKEYEKKISPK